MLLNRNHNGSAVTQCQPRLGLNPSKIKRDVVVIGASAGGVTALAHLFGSLPPDLPASIGVVLHRSASPGHLAHVLGRRSALPVIEPKDGMRLNHGLIYLAPADHHLLFERNTVRIQRGPREHSTRPAIDPLFRSSAAALHKRVLGILLTGCGEDGVSGLISISQHSGLTLAQDPSEAYMPYMPRNALRFDQVAGVFRLDEMASVISALARGRAVANKVSSAPLTTSEAS
jgi:two-component system, chemotaxis family, protein-glutamate methylesterase/glutaminase